MRQRNTWFIVVVALAGVVALGVRQQAAESELPMAKAESVGMSTKRLERIHSYIQGYMDRNEIAGAVTLVARHGKIAHFDAQGYRYKEENAPMQKDTIFSLMSMTKPIVSTALRLATALVVGLFALPILSMQQAYTFLHPKRVKRPIRAVSLAIMLLGVVLYLTT